MKNLKKIFTRFITYLAMLAVVVIIAAVSRAVSIARYEGAGIQVGGEKSFFRFLWLELKQAFMFSRL